MKIIYLPFLFLFLFLSVSTEIQPQFTSASLSVDQVRSCKTGEIKRGNECVPIANATDAEVRQYMINRSIASYSGSCPCDVRSYQKALPEDC